MRSNFWETLERVASLVDGPPIVRPRLVVLKEQPTATDVEHPTVPSPTATLPAVAITDADRDGKGDVSASAGMMTVQMVQPVTTAWSVVRSSPPATPVVQAGAIFDAFGAIEVVEEDRNSGHHEAEGSEPAAGQEQERGVEVSSWDDFANEVASNEFLTGLVAKHRMFAKAGAIDIDLDPPRRRWRRWRRRWGTR